MVTGSSSKPVRKPAFLQQLLCFVQKVTVINVPLYIIHVIGGDKESSSDWSSSDDESNDDDDMTSDNLLRPSTHSTLQAQWEWRTMEAAETSHSEKWVKVTFLSCVFLTWHSATQCMYNTVSV